MFVNKEEQRGVVRYDGVEYDVYYKEISAYEDDTILQRAMKVERGRSRGSVSARSRIAAINRERFLASVKRIEYSEPDSEERKVVQMDASVYSELSRGFRDAVLGEIVEPVVLPEEEDVEDFTGSPTPPSTGSP